MKYQSVLFTGANSIELGELEGDFFPLGAYDVLARTQVSLISAGTELACLSGVEAWFGFPGTPGYASVSEVVAVGAAVRGISEGDLVYGMGGHRQYQLYDTCNPRALCVKVPPGLDAAQAVFTRMICVSFTALRISSIELGDYVAVTGLGLVGNFAAQLAQLQGGNVIGLDLSARRAQLARDCGIRHALQLDPATVADDIAAITGAAEVTTLIEATGNPRALPGALPWVGRYGEVILLGTPRGAFQSDVTELLSQVHLDGNGSLSFKGAHEWRYPVQRDAFVKHSILRNAELALDYISSGALQVAPLHTHTLPPARAAEAYAGLRDKKDDYIGVVFDWRGLPPAH